MLQKISIPILIFVIASCSSVRKNTITNNDNKLKSIGKVESVSTKPIKTTQIVNYSGIPGIKDIYFNNASSAINYKGTIL